MLVEGVICGFCNGMCSRSYHERTGSGRHAGWYFAAGSQVFRAVESPFNWVLSLPCLRSVPLLTTLDTCTRLTRFLIEELFSWRNEASRYLGTAMALALPCLLVFQQFPGTDGTPATCMESNLAPIRSNQSITCCSRFAYLCGLFESIQGLWICPASCGSDDRDADDSSRFDGPKIWNFHLAWRNRCSDVPARILPNGHFVAKTYPIRG